MFPSGETTKMSGEYEIEILKSDKTTLVAYVNVNINIKGGIILTICLSKMPVTFKKKCFNHLDRFLMKLI